MSREDISYREIGESSFVTTPCPKCDSGESAVIVDGVDYLHGIQGTYFVSECTACGFWFQNPMPDEARHPSLYPPNYLPHASVTTGPPTAAMRGLKGGVKRLIRLILSMPVIDSFARRRQKGIGLVPDVVPQGRVLEIGCSSGGRLQSLKEAGWAHLHGIEMVPAAAAKASSLGFHVEVGRVEDILPSFPDGHFDVVITSMVVEHLCNPFQVVNEIARKLKPGGQFLFSTIVRDSLDHRMYGKYWAGFDFPRHMVHFRLRDVQDMLAADFAEVECFFHGAPIDFVRSSSWRKKAIDRLLIFLFSSKLGIILGLLLGLMAMTCRVSFRCRRSASPANRE